MSNQKKIKPKKKDNLKRRPQNLLDARVLAMKCRAKEHAERTVGEAVSAAAVAYDFQAPLPDHPEAAREGEGILDDDNEQANYDHDHDSVDRNNVDIAPYAIGREVLAQYAHGINMGFWSGRRQQEEMEWRHRYPAMFPVFVECQHKTANWSNELSNSDLKEPCSCSGSVRTLDVLDLNCKFRCLSHCNTLEYTS